MNDSSTTALVKRGMDYQAKTAVLSAVSLRGHRFVRRLAWKCERCGRLRPKQWPRLFGWLLIRECPGKPVAS